MYQRFIIDFNKPSLHPTKCLSVFCVLFLSFRDDVTYQTPHPPPNEDFTDFIMGLTILEKIPHNAGVGIQSFERILNLIILGVYKKRIITGALRWLSQKVTYILN